MNTLIRVEIAPKRAAAECGKSRATKMLKLRPAAISRLCVFLLDSTNYSGGKPVPAIDACPGTAPDMERHPQVKEWSEILLIAICV